MTFNFGGSGSNVLYYKRLLWSRPSSVSVPDSDCCLFCNMIKDSPDVLREGALVEWPLCFPFAFSANNKLGDSETCCLWVWPAAHLKKEAVLHSRQVHNAVLQHPSSYLLKWKDCSEQLKMRYKKINLAVIYIFLPVTVEIQSWEIQDS